MRVIIYIFQIVLGFLLCWSTVSGQTNASDSSSQLHAVTNAQAAVEYALTYTGFARERAIPLSSAGDLAEEVQYQDDETPFLSGKYDGKQVWRVRFDSVYLRFEGCDSAVIENNPKNFDVFIDPETGKLLKVESRFSGYDPDMVPELKAEDAEEKLRRHGEIYYAPPNSFPRVTLMEALEAAVFVSQPLAKEIIAIYVMHSRGGKPPKPVWCITARGFPPIPSFSRYGEDIPEYLLNRMRTVIDATTGAHLFVTTIPQVEWRRESEGKE